jgi:hypothetical protein
MTPIHALGNVPIIILDTTRSGTQVKPEGKRERNYPGYLIFTKKTYTTSKKCHSF